MIADRYETPSKKICLFVLENLMECLSVYDGIRPLKSLESLGSKDFGKMSVSDYHRLQLRATHRRQRGRKEMAEEIMIVPAYELVKTTRGSGNVFGDVPLYRSVEGIINPAAETELE